MAVAIDNTSTGSGGSGVDTISWSHTCAGSDRILLVGIQTFPGLGGTPTGVTYNSVAMTQIYNERLPSGTGDQLSLYYLLNPASGANTILVSSTGSMFFPLAAAVSLTGAKQSSQPEAQKTGSQNSGTSISDSLTTTIAGSWVLLFCVTPGNSITAGASTTLRIRSGSCAFLDPNAVTTPAGSQTINVNTNSGASGWAMLAIADVTPPATGSAFTPISNLLTLNVS